MIACIFSIILFIVAFVCAPFSVHAATISKGLVINDTKVVWRGKTVRGNQVLELLNSLPFESAKWAKIQCEAGGGMITMCSTTVYWPEFFE